MKDIKLDDALVEVKSWPIARTEFDPFNDKLTIFFNSVRRSTESGHRESVFQIYLQNFLHDTFYGDNHLNVLPDNDTDLAIKRDDEVLVMFELKAPSNSQEMVKKDDLNRKALHEIVWYYLSTTRHIENNRAVRNLECSVRRLLITNFVNFFEFDSVDFERLVLSDNSKIEKLWLECNLELSNDNRRAAFYSRLEQYFDTVHVLEKVPFTFFSFKDECRNIGRRKLLFRFFSKDYLIKEKRIYVPNIHELKKPFYNELLYIMGLEEYIDNKSNKPLIRISTSSNDFLASQVRDQLINDRGMSRQKAEDFAFELSVTWVNRLLFLKLFEGLLIDVNGDSLDYKILDNSKIHNFKELNDVFFEVLGQRPEEREDNAFFSNFSKIPYLNSSLFERTDAEYDSISIKNIENRVVIKYQKSVVAGNEDITLLEYTNKFLASWKFSTSDNELEQNESNFIDASVLGLIFEKINGYKDGSFYTPTAITEFIAFESVSKVIVTRFNESFDVRLNDLKEVKDFISENNLRKESNDLINTITYCDPAVGSGHFLVSLLNRIIEVKSYLGCLFYYNCDERVLDYRITVFNDDLVIKDGQGNNFKYNKNSFESQRMQKTLFCEKRKIIENCLFGADLNENAVSICRLRLWIELLKNAYYENGRMETLPNIDINIRSGDSVSHTRNVTSGNAFQDASFDKSEKELLKTYKSLVKEYKGENNKNAKRRIKERIYTVSRQLKNALLSTHYEQLSLFGQNTSRIQPIATLSTDESFVQWDFDFPDLLTDSGVFLGFDCIVGNPPFMRLQGFDNRYLRELEYQNYLSYSKESDLYCLFIELGKRILKNNGVLMFISSRQWMRTLYGKNLRKFLTTEVNPLLLIDLGPGVFESACVDSAILMYEKNRYQNRTLSCKSSKYDLGNLHDYVKDNGRFIDFSLNDMWIITSETEDSILEKISLRGTPLKEWNISIKYGIKTGCNEAFIVDEKTKNRLIEKDQNSALLIKKMVRGQDLGRYSCSSEQYLLLIHNGVRQLNIPPVDINNYPAIKEYLDRFYSKLTKRGDKGITPYNLRDCSYLNDFNNAKIIYSDISQSPKFYLDMNGYYCNNTTYIMNGEKLAVLTACLNSKIYATVFKLFFSGGGLGEDGYRYFKEFLEKLPIVVPDINDEKYLADRAMAITQKNDNMPLANQEIEDKVSQLIGLTDEEKEYLLNQ